ncbi:MAG: TonB-dependent receptor [Elusimicrobiota bacterium]|nr:TonB-dependent receptor [Elusimicrobiota bacterium]
MKKYFLFVVTAAVVFAGGCFAFTGGTIFVRADRYPGLVTGEAGSVDTIDRREISNSGQDELSSLLEEKVDVVILRSGIGSASGIAVRGVSGGGMNNKVRLYVNGVPVNTLRKGFNLESVDLHTVERIEVIRGPSSALYGGGALVGAINIVTAPITKTIVAGAGVGSYNTKKSNFMLADKTGPFSYRLNASVLDTDGHIRNFGGTHFCNPARITNGGATVNYTADRDFLSFAVRDFRATRDDAEFFIKGPLAGTYSGQVENVRERSGFYSLNYSHSFDKSRLKLKVFNIVDDEQSSELPRETAQNRGVSVQFENALAGAGMLFSGVDFENHYLHADASGLTFKRNYTAPFLHLVLGIVPDKLTFSAGARYDMPDKFDNKISPKIGLVYNLTGRLRLRSGLNYGFRYPTVTDLYSATSPLGNSALKCETSKNIEAGADYFGSNFGVSCTVFKMIVNDMIISQVINPGPPKVKGYVNVGGESPYKGLEIKSSLDVSRHVALGAVYSYLDPGDLTFHTDKHRLKASAAFSFGQHFLELSSTFAKDRYLWDNETSERVDYDLYNLNYTRRFRKTAKFYVRVNNIGDRDYFVNFYNPAPGRHVMTGIEYEF